MTGHFRGESLVRLVPDVSMTEDEIADLKRLFAVASAEDDELVHTSAIFTRRPLQGWWRYRDRFQLRPAPADAPKAGLLAAPHPAYLDVKVRTSEHGLLNSVRLAKLQPAKPEFRRLST